MIRHVTASVNHTLDALLELICVRIQLTRTQHTSATGHYDAVSDWLSKDGSPVRLLSPHIYPQGSLSLGTTTKPLRQAEFDLDAVCRLDILHRCHPGAVYRLIWERMSDNGIYRPMMRRLPRCIRLEYSGDFHLDIVPAVPDLDAGGKCILVPDLNANLALDHPENDEWKPSNPLGYADWFENRCAKAILMEKYAMAQVDPVPAQEPIHAKPSLKRSVQLFKRWRDLEFQKRPKLAPTSIILTTLSGHLHRGEPLCTDALRTILNGTVKWIESGEPICLKNPRNDKESICEKWENDPASYVAFTEAVNVFRDRWERLLEIRGLNEIQDELADLFEEAPVNWAINELARKQVVQPWKKRTLGIQSRTGTLAPSTGGASLLLRPNTFFGDAKNADQNNGTP
jgi:hypothetical protein